MLLSNATAQQLFTIKGTVYDSSRVYPMPGVSVLTSSGKGTSTNSNGYYEINVTEKDSIWFSYLNKPTIKFPVLSIKTPLQFDIALQISIPVLGEVKIRPPDYRLDSIRNREEYAKIFDYRKPGIKVGSSNFGAGVGFDLDEMVNMFRFKRNKSTLNFQKRLILQEQDKFIDHRFSKALVRRLTRLSGEELDSFMVSFRPNYLFASIASDYDFQKYILDSFGRFKKGLPPENPRKGKESEF
ncbi:MAG: hypothetical protein B6D37_14150 [Sphingobacteriales bacterium UTBCD1]|nr:MAG: hypothetical protein B6D37_14150 [Sphingobacteriales bacterium UTBCD1]